VKTAVLYLRVSTPSQVNTDYDPEGISIPAQRLACERKAEQMGVTVIDEYVEPGRSATTVLNRPVFQALLARLKQERDVDYVIVYNLSRLNRNRIDDAQVLMAMRASKVTLVSAQENIDETPAGQLMHGILAAFNEYRSSADGADIRYKMGQKAKAGGTLNLAPIGYLNVRDQIDGHEVRTVKLDPDRAPFIKLAFELCATGDYTMTRIAKTLADRGLRMRPRAGQPAGLIHSKSLPKILRDRYYLGVVVYQGNEYAGRHDALVDRELFDKVQAVLDIRAARDGERERKHHHYLKSTVWCGRCREQGRESRFILIHANGHGGEYWYFMCSGRSDRSCDLPYLPVDDVETAVIDHYASLQLPSGFATRVREILDATLTDEHGSNKASRNHLTAALAALDRQEENLLDFIANGDMPSGKVRGRLAQIAEERARVQAELAETKPSFDSGVTIVRSALDLLDNPQELYRQTTDRVRRQLNQVFFERLYVEIDGVTDDQLAPPFSDFVRRRLARPSHQRQKPNRPPTRSGTPKGATRRTISDLLGRIARAQGSSKAEMVELRGIEPRTSSMRTKRATNCATAPNTDRSANVQNNTSARNSQGTPTTRAEPASQTALNDSPTSKGTFLETFSCAATAISLPYPSATNSRPDAQACRDASTVRPNSRYAAAAALASGDAGPTPALSSASITAPAPHRSSTAGRSRSPGQRSPAPTTAIGPRVDPRLIHSATALALRRQAPTTLDRDSAS